jgi:hypothetical protein
MASRAVEDEYRPQIDATRKALFAKRDELLAQTEAVRRKIESFDQALLAMGMSPMPRPTAPKVIERRRDYPAVPRAAASVAADRVFRSR